MIPVFIGGCDRSGTTLLGSMLGTHSDCLCVPESQFIINVFNRGYQFDPTNSDISKALADINKDPRFGLWNVDLGSVASLPERAKSSYSGLIEWIVQQYGKSTGKPSPDLWIDHTPWNVKYAATLCSLFPVARLIHIVRDGRAVVSSILEWEAGPKTIDKAAYFWLRNLAFGLAAENYLGAGRVIRINYESLVKEPESTLKEIASFLGLDYQPDMVQGEGFRVPEFTKKHHALVGQKPDVARVNAWKKLLSWRQIEIFEAITGDMLPYLGYDLLFDAKKRPMTTHESIVSHLKNYQMFMAHFRQRIRLLWSARKTHKARSRTRER